MEAKAEASSRDLLQRFAGSTSLSDRPEQTPPEAVAGDEIELSLGLSLGGCFSSEPREKNRLIRSSSISTFCMFTSRDENFPAPAAPLARTCSLPVVGAGEEYRKRKELQSLKRLEAKRKRSEKRNSSKLDQLSGCPWFPGSTQFGGPGLPGSGRVASRLPLSQGSIGSQGSSSSGGASEFDRPQMQGLDISRISNFSETKSPSMPDHSNHKVSANKDLKKCGRRGSEMEEMERSMMEEMPCVSTRGDGPNGRRIEGFLYKYRKGEEVRIVCVCHGSFLTPAEFVKHAGGGDVDHPLRHIVVNPSSAFL